MVGMAVIMAPYTEQSYIENRNIGPKVAITASTIPHCRIPGKFQGLDVHRQFGPPTRFPIVMPTPKRASAIGIHAASTFATSVTIGPIKV